MPVNIIGTLKPKNNGKFPVAEAVDIKVTDDLRLDKALEKKADLSTLNFTLAGKADNSDVTNLQEQINNIISPVTEDAEVINARVGADGTNYSTLKARLDAETNAINAKTDKIISNINEIAQPINLLKSAVNVYKNTGINTTTGAKVSGQSGRDLYIIAVSSGDYIYFTQCSGSIMQVGYYSDSEADTFLYFAYNKGLNQWNKAVTIPSDVHYIGISVDTSYTSTAFVGYNSNYNAWTNGYEQKLSSEVYIQEVNDLETSLNEVNTDISTLSDSISNIEQPLNMLQSAVNVYANTGINVNTGAKQASTNWTLYVMKVTSGEKYYITTCATSIMQIGFYSDSEATEFIGFAYNSGWDQWNKEYTIPESVNYIAVTVTPDYVSSAFFGKKSDYVALTEGYIAKLSDTFYIDASKFGSEWVTIGIGTEHPTIKEGFAYARSHDKKVVIAPGTYDLVEEGIEDTDSGFILPKEVHGYGVTFLCNLDTENWNISPVNISGSGQGTKLYGITIICSNCRYCIHDERGYATGGYYHNIFKDLNLIHNSAASSTLTNPQCIGGGLGNGGYIEIENCVFDSKVSNEVTYHSYAHKSAPDAPYDNQTIPCTVIIKDSWFKHKASATSIGSYTTVMNKMYINNCSIGTAITHSTETNIEIIDWNNSVRT